MAPATEAPATTTAEGPTQHVPNQSEALAKLREPFPAEQVSKLPKVTCGNCRDARYKVCDRHNRVRCDGCNGNLTDAHIHLDYVGHADITLRLLEADPLWTWEPMAFDANGLPKFDEHGGMWIRLTVGGHQRIGYGDAQNKKGPNAVKEVIGDALRNAAMRFGAGTVLWSKSDAARAQAEAKALSDAPSRDERLEELYLLMNKRWGHLEGLRAVKAMVGQEEFHESRVHDEHQNLRPFGELIDERIRELAEAKKVDAFMTRVRRGWNDITATEQSLAEAREKSLLDHKVPAGPEKVPTRVEDLLTTRLQEMRAKRAAPSGTGDADAAQRAEDELVHQRLNQVYETWNNPVGLATLHAQIVKEGINDRPVEGPDGTPISFDVLLNGRINELNANNVAQGGAEGSAA